MWRRARGKTRPGLVQTAPHPLLTTCPASLACHRHARGRMLLHPYIRGCCHKQEEIPDSESSLGLPSTSSIPYKLLEFRAPWGLPGDLWTMPSDCLDTPDSPVPASADGCQADSCDSAGTARLAWGDMHLSHTPSGRTDLSTAQKGMKKLSATCLVVGAGLGQCTKYENLYCGCVLQGLVLQVSQPSQGCSQFHGGEPWLRGLYQVHPAG